MVTGRDFFFEGLTEFTLTCHFWLGQVLRNRPNGVVFAVDHLMRISCE